MASQIVQGDMAEIVIDGSMTPSAASMGHRNNLSIMRAQRSASSILARFHAGYFRMSFSLGGQALLWKILLETNNNKRQTTTTMSTVVLHLPRPIYTTILFLVWGFAFLILVFLSFVYVLRCFFQLKMVKAEFLHHVGVNYLFAPWISWLLLLQSAPFLSPKDPHYLVLWWVFTVPIVVLDVKIYGQWFTKGKRFLTAVANPTSQLSVIGNLVGARAAAEMGWEELSVFLFSLGMIHYLVLFVTLYQRLSGSDRIPAVLRPVFFLFIAVPSTASLTWSSIAGTFDTVSKMLFFLSLFQFTSLVCRPALFRKSMRKFSVAWWAYSFPVTSLALASAKYTEVVKGGVAYLIMLSLSVLSIMVTLGLLVFTAINPKNLLPEDDPILITLSLPSHSSRTA